jgi:hypothetical protein
MTQGSEAWRGRIIVVFNNDVSQQTIQDIVAAQGCEFESGFTGVRRVNVLKVTPGEDEAKVAAFAALPEVKTATLNNGRMVALERNHQ